MVCHMSSILVQVMAWCCQATSHYPNQCWARFMSPYSFTRPQYVNPSLPNATYMRQWTLWELVKVMACRLFDAKPLPQPMLTYCQLDPNLSEIWIKITKNFIHKNAFENAVCEMAAILSRESWVNVYIWLQTALLAGILLVICSLTPRCDLFGVNLFIQGYHA